MRTVRGKPLAPLAVAEAASTVSVRPGPAQLPVEGSRLATSWANLRFLVVKVTRRCNLDCSYCYEDIGSGADMTLETFQRTANAALDSTTSERVGFLFHGGEPTLLGVDWYRKALDYADAAAKRTGKVADYKMQSNLVSVDRRFLDLFLERDIHVGVSMDGPPDMNDETRGAGRKVVENFKRGKAEGLRVGVLATINHSNWDRMPILKARRDILDHMLETGGNGVIEENLERELIKFVDKRSCSNTLCDGQLCGAGSQVLGVTPEGNLLPCGRFEWNDRSWSLGSVSDTDDQAFQFRGEQMRRFWGVSDYNWADCGTCRARHMCSYSCQAFVVRSKSQLNIECTPTLGLYDYLTEQPDGKVEALVATLKLHKSMVNNTYVDGMGYNDYDDNHGYNDYRRC
eukprot:evm.model.scf_875.1 EVM.evm.TU.scf_875.1   scf_875:14384-15711(+)